MAPHSKAAQEYAALRDDASAGQLMMRGDAADLCAAECRRYARELTRLRDQIDSGKRPRPLADPGAFGNFASGQELGRKFQQLIAGRAGAEPSIVERLDERIAMVTAMAETYQRAGMAYREHDAELARTLRTTGPGPK